VAARSKACTVFARSDAGIVGSNPTQGMMSVCVFCVCVVLLVGSGSCYGLIPGPKSPTERVKNQETEKPAKVRRAVVP
jgi:hypothetical protein